MTSTEVEIGEQMDSKNDYTEWILDTIDQLRKRKARPDLDRICHMVARKHKASFTEIAAELDKLVENQVVVKVDYKGSISYRNAAKWRKSHFGNVQNSSSSSAKLEAAVRSLTGFEDDCHDEVPGSGAADERPPLAEVAAADIERWLLEREPGTKLSGDTLQVALDREVDAYNLERTEEGNYIIGDPSKKPPPPEKGEKVKNGGSKPRSKPKVKKVAAADGEVPPSADPDTPKKNKPSKKKAASAEAGPHVQKVEEEKQPVQQQKVEIKTEEKMEVEEAPAAEPVSQKSKISSTQAQIQQILSTMKPEPMKPKKKEEDEVEDSGDKKKDPPPSVAAVSSPLKTPSKNKNTRPASGKRKRIRKSHGPDFEESFSPPKKERRRISMEEEEEEEMEEPEEVEEPEVSEADEEPCCDFCLFSYHCADGSEEELLFCKDCPAKAHPSCMDYSEELARRARTSPWQCIECKTCYYCTESRDPDSMLFCDACDKGFHMDCHDPPVKSKPTGKWMCKKCVADLEKEQRRKREDGSMEDHSHSDGGGASCLPTPTDSPLHFDSTEPPHTHFSQSLRMNGGMVVTPVPKLATTMKADVPDASDWTIGDVVEFFLDMGFTEQADVFKEQEIDGRSLLLMKRSDVLQGLGLKLGPALKIYAHIQRLQTRGHIVY